MCLCSATTALLRRTLSRSMKTAQSKYVLVLSLSSICLLMRCGVWGVKVGPTAVFRNMRTDKVLTLNVESPGKQQRTTLVLSMHMQFIALLCVSFSVSAESWLVEATYAPNDLDNIRLEVHLSFRHSLKSFMYLKFFSLFCCCVLVKFSAVHRSWVQRRQ